MPQLFKISRKTSRYIGWTYLEIVLHSPSLIPVLQYLHAIITYTITGRSNSQTVITTMDAEILSHMFRGISIDLTYVFAHQARATLLTLERRASVSICSSSEWPDISALTHLRLDVATLPRFCWIR